MNKFVVSFAPHIKRNTSVITQNMFMILALLPSISLSIIFYGVDAFLIMLISTIACLVFDIAFSHIVFGKFDPRDISSVVTGLVLGLCMPIGINIGFVILASFISVFVAKILFGGQGKAIVNESALGVALLAGLLAGFSTSLVSYATSAGDAIVSPLEYFAEGNYTKVPILDLLLGKGGGLLGTSSAIASIIGGIILCATLVYDFYIPVFAIISFIVTILITKGATAFLPELFAGSFLFVTFFMLPSHSSSPTNWISKSVYAILFGVLVALTRGNYIFGEAGVFFCLLLVNLLAPVLDAVFGMLFCGRRTVKYE